MKAYGDLNLPAIMQAENLDFARWTYGRGQCSCCYGPFDMPKEFWKDGKKPRKRYLDTEKRSYIRVLGSKQVFDKDITYILFKNANNGSGTVTAENVIKDYTCIGYQLRDMEQVYRICDLLQAQLDDDYSVVKPENMLTCIVIRTKGALT